jgi:hypothetical protein
MTAIDPVTVFRFAIAAQGTALLVQALLAGLATSGSDAALDAHKPSRRRGSFASFGLHVPLGVAKRESR